MAMILALSSLLSYVESDEAQQASRAIVESVFESLHDGNATTDLGVHIGTTDFTDEIIRRVSVGRGYAGHAGGHFLDVNEALNVYSCWK